MTAPQTVERHRLPRWAQDYFSDGQLTLSPRARWQKAVTMPGCRLSPTAQHVALVLSTFMDEGGECWPSLATLAAHCNRGEGSVRRALNELGVRANAWAVNARTRRCVEHRADGERCRGTALSHADRAVCARHATAEERATSRRRASEGEPRPEGEPADWSEVTEGRDGAFLVIETGGRGRRNRYRGCLPRVDPRGPVDNGATLPRAEGDPCTGGRVTLAPAEVGSTQEVSKEKAADAASSTEDDPQPHRDPARVAVTAEGSPTSAETDPGSERRPIEAPPDAGPMEAAGDDVEKVRDMVRRWRDDGMPRDRILWHLDRLQGAGTYSPDVLDRVRDDVVGATREPPSLEEQTESLRRFALQLTEAGKSRDEIAHTLDRFDYPADVVAAALDALKPEPEEATS